MLRRKERIKFAEMGAKRSQALKTAKQLVAMTPAERDAPFGDSSHSTAQSG